jgi:hypothetical protein
LLITLLLLLLLLLLTLLLLLNTLTTWRSHLGMSGLGSLSHPFIRFL